MLSEYKFDFLVQTFELQVQQEVTPELDEVFQVRLTSLWSDDGSSGSTNTSGGSISSERDSVELVIQENDYPYGLLQFSPSLGIIPATGVMIDPVMHVVEVLSGHLYCIPDFFSIPTFFSRLSFIFAYLRLSLNDYLLSE